MIVRDGDLASRVDAHADRVVGNAFSTNLSKIVSFIVEHLDAVSSVVRDENLLSVIDNNSVGEL